MQVAEKSSPSICSGDRVNLKMLWEPEFQGIIWHVEGFVDLEALGQCRGSEEVISQKTLAAWLQ